LLLFCTLILVAYWVRVALRGRVRYERLDRTEGSGLLPRWAVEAFYWALQAPGRGLLRARVDPDAITYLALALSLASLPLIAGGHLVEAGLCVALGGALDVLDGMVARAAGRASAAGAVLDSVTDRVADGAPFVGLALLYRGSAAALLVPLSALVASFVVSYARARAEVHGLRLPDGPMRRHERIVYLVAALVVGSWIPPSPALPGVPYPGTLLGVGVVAAGAAVGAVVLVARIRAALGGAGRAARGGEAENSRSLPPAC
jgi:CDP-diacylglycerol--glycerol-3-phosphate 3-phosphatidyltransferase